MASVYPVLLKQSVVLFVLMKMTLLKDRDSRTVHNDRPQSMDGEYGLEIPDKGDIPIAKETSIQLAKSNHLLLLFLDCFGMAF